MCYVGPSDQTVALLPTALMQQFGLGSKITHVHLKRSQEMYSVRTLELLDFFLVHRITYRLNRSYIITSACV